MQIPVEQMPDVLDDLAERVRTLAVECAAWKARALAAERERSERLAREQTQVAPISEPAAEAPVASPPPSLAPPNGRSEPRPRTRRAST